MHKVGVIGIGDFGSFAVRAFELLDDFELYAISDIVPFRKIENVIYYRNYHDLISDDNIDVVYICTENFNHVSMSIEALEKGKAVVCEKPLFINLAEAKKLESAILKFNRPYKTNFVLPNSLLYQEVIRITTKKELGELKYIAVENYATESKIKKKWYHKDSKTGGWFATSDIHFIHLLSLLSDEKPELEDSIKQYEIELVTSTFCHLSIGNVPVILFHHMNASGREDCKAKFIFEDGEISIFGWVPMKLALKKQNLVETIQELAGEKEVYLKLIAKNFENLFAEKEFLKEDFAKAVEANVLALEANENHKYKII